MKVAIVHDQLQEFGGAERVLVALKDLYPDADVYTSFFSPDSLGVHGEYVKDWNVKTSWADKVPLLKKLYSPLRFITPLLWESLDLSAYDLVISSSGSYMSKGVITKPDTLHVCYLHHPPRYLYYYETALEWQKYLPVRVYGNYINHDLRVWDFLSSQRVDYFVANSEETKQRVEKLYRREADVIYPPVRIPEKLEFTHRPKESTEYYLTISRLARAKHIDILIQAANKHKFNLKIVGKGRDEAYLRSLAGPTVEFVGGVSDHALLHLYRNAKAFLFSAVDEEFGIAPIEAMAHMVPVIAYASGGLKETVEDGKNGFLYSTLDPDALYEQVKTIEEMSVEKYKALCEGARKSAEKYSESVFAKKFAELVNSKLKSHARTSRG